ncbi:MAG: type II secretion system F family protein, partial [Patescibacteria group bacterium]
TNMFRSLDVELPWSTRFVLWFSVFISNYGREIILLSLIIIITALIILRFTPVKKVSHWVLLRTPIVGSFIKNLNLARITRMMGTLLKSGVPMGEVITITAPILKNYYYKKLINQASKDVDQGKGLAQSFARHQKLMPPIARRLIAVGEESGTLDKMFLYLADFYELEIKSMTKYLSNLFEPMLIVCIGVIVMVLALSIITPMYSVLSGY